MTDLYKILNVARGASQDEIKKSYRKLAKDLHPDTHPGDAKVEEQFKRVSAAYTILSDPEMRARYDRGEIDDTGQERGGFRGHQAHGGPGGFAGGFNVEDILGDLFGGRFGGGGGGGGGQGPRMRASGQDVKYEISVDFIDAARGGTRRVTLSGGQTLDVRIPAGVADGQTIRLKGQGGGGMGGGPAGDALIKVEVRPHPTFSRDGSTIRLELPITLPEAVLGGKIDVETVDGPVTMTVPAGSNTGDTLRLKGKGLPKSGSKTRGARGDQFVKLKIVLPDDAKTSLRDVVESWASDHPYSVR
jgi:DnaJ-class molecular chaperone